MSRFRFGLTFLLGLAALLSTDLALPYSYTMMRDADLRAQAPVVYTARVEAVLGGFATPGGIETRYRLSLGNVLQGRLRDRPIVLALPGGELPNGAGQMAYGVPTLKAGERVLLFAAVRRDGIHQAMQLSLGVFFEQTVGGQRVYMRYLDADSATPKSRNSSYQRVRDAAGFEMWLRDADAAPDDAPYFLDGPAFANEQAKFNLLRDTTSTQPIRWFQFDTNTALLWVSTVGSDPTITANRFTMLTNAANALTNDAGSRLTVTHASGTIASPDTHCNDLVSDGHSVLWNDPLNQLAGSYSCAGGGTLAFGGPCYSNALQNSNGQQYHNAFEGRITVQDGVGCEFNGNSGADGAEVMLHEMGHVVGLAHSCGDSATGSCSGGSAADNAIMRAFAHLDGRGATLQPDDLAALTFVYPVPAVPPNLTISDVSVTEGNAGTTTATFTVSLSAATNQAVTFNFATADGTATTANSDYVSSSGSRNIAAGQTSTTINVTVNGDTAIEANETFVVNLTNVVNAVAVDAQGTGTITNDDVPPTLSINDASVTEGNAGTKLMTFTVSLSAASSQLVTATFNSANGTATTANADYLVASGLVSLPAGQLSASVNVTINGDTAQEADETLFVNLSSPSNATLADGQGLGTILDDDNRIFAHSFE
ncbi:Calx-beta domain-containing protein [Ahniella affigens]|nr:Calx-beta domain-containing protein [Ahniella affigens]